MRALLLGFSFLLISFVSVYAEPSHRQTYERGVNLIKNGYNKEAVEHLSTIINQNVDGLVHSSYVNRAQAYKNLGMFTESLNDIRVAEKKAQAAEKVRIRVFIAELLMRKNQLTDAIEIFENILNTKTVEDMKPAVVEVIRSAYIISLIRDEQIDRAERQFGLLSLDKMPTIEGDPTSGFKFMLKAIVEIMQENHSAALMSSKKAVFTTDKIMLFPIGAIAANLSGDSDLALEILKSYSDQKPISYHQKAMFSRIKSALLQIEEDPNYKTIKLEHENRDRLKKLMNYKVVLNNFVRSASVKENGFSINLGLSTVE